ncbi:MAG: WD40/YVTN/BNR-like repeat-containing protein, partial [Ginsengibacter sp.]
GGDSWTQIPTGAAADYTGDIIRVIINPKTNDVYFATKYTNFTNGGFTLGGIYKKTSAGFVQINNGLPDDKITIISDFDYSLDNAGTITLYASNQVNADASNPNDFGIWSYTENSNQWVNMNNNINFFDIATQSSTNNNALGGSIHFAVDHTPGAPHGIYAAVTNRISGNLMNVFQLLNGEWQPIGNKISGVLSTNACLDFGLSESGALYVGLGNTGNQAIYQSTDNGNNWISVINGIGIPAITPHVDQRSFGFNLGKVYLGNDGGIYRFNPLPNGQPGQSTWESLNTNSLQTILVQGASIDPSNQNNVLCGSQDNSVTLLNNSTWINAAISSGDNGRIRFDPNPDNNGQYAYATSVSDYVFFFRSDDGGKTWSDKSPADARTQHAAIGNYSPFSINPANTSNVAVGIDRVYESVDRGDNWGIAKSPVLGSECSAIAYAGNGIIWVAYGSSLYETVNDGGDGTASNWTDESEGIDFGGKIIQIVIDPRNKQNVYVATNNGVIWKRMLYYHKTTWETISSTLPKVTINTLALVPTNGIEPPMLFAGTNTGVFASFDNGNSWTTYNSGLPIHNVTDLQFTSNPGVMVAGLYGRGIFKTYFPPQTDVA